MTDNTKTPRIAESLDDGRVVVNVGSVDGLVGSCWLYMAPMQERQITDPLTGEELGTMAVDSPYYVYLDSIHPRFSVGTVWNIPNLCDGMAMRTTGWFTIGRMLSYQMPDGVRAGTKAGCL
jgi:hypothetical protein